MPLNPWFLSDGPPNFSKQSSFVDSSNFFQFVPSSSLSSYSSSSPTLSKKRLLSDSEGYVNGESVQQGAVMREGSDEMENDNEMEVEKKRRKTGCER